MKCCNEATTKQNIMIYLAQKDVKHPTFKTALDMGNYILDNSLMIEDLKKINNIWKVTLKNN